MNCTIITYGGAEILNHIFNAIAVLFKNGFVNNLMIISASIGFLLAVSKAFFSNSFEYLTLRFFLPLFLFASLLSLKTSTVKIEDRLTNQWYTVSGVPFILAKFSEVTSSIGYRLSCALETTMHTPDDTSYNATGMIFGADHALQMERYEITNPDFKRNLNSFAKQCIMYDLQIGKYSINDTTKQRNNETTTQ